MFIKNKNWSNFFEIESNKKYFSEIEEYLKKRNEEGAIVYPKENDIFNAYEITSPNEIKIVIIGQDPYHGKDQAHGLAFSVENDIKIPPSLKNMYKELEDSVEGFIYPNNGNLEKWAKQGVFLLNNVLTVEEKSPDSHKGIGWEYFTKATIDYINTNCENVVFILWGGNARKNAKSINKEKHLVLESAHPSPLSSYRGFFGCNHFNKANDFLELKKIKKIDW